MNSLSALGSKPRRPCGHCGASEVAAAFAVTNRMEDSVKLTDTQLVLLSAASQRADRGLERPANLTGAPAGKVVAKLLAEGLVQEIQSHGSLPIWRRDEDGSRSLRITKKGLRAIQVEDEASGSADPAKKPPAQSATRPDNQLPAWLRHLRGIRGADKDRFDCGQRQIRVWPHGFRPTSSTSRGRHCSALIFRRKARSQHNRMPSLEF
jgi:hypothetical protein